MAILFIGSWCFFVVRPLLSIFFSLSFLLADDRPASLWYTSCYTFFALFILTIIYSIFYCVSCAILASFQVIYTHFICEVVMLLILYFCLIYIIVRVPSVNFLSCKAAIDLGDRDELQAFKVTDFSFVVV